MSKRLTTNCLMKLLVVGKKKKKRFDVPLSEDRVVTGYTNTHTETTIQRNERWRMRCVLMLIGA